MTIKLRKLAFTPPPEPKNEHERLEELYALKILDTATDERFDQYTRLIADIFDVPMSFISFVDKERQWSKSAYGIEARELPRELSFCAHALTEPPILVVPDAQQDSRFAGNPFVDGPPNIRFYAGAVIHGRGGEPLGTCCAIDREPRMFSLREQTLLRHIAGMVERELQLNVEAADLVRRLQEQAELDTFTRLPKLPLFLARSERAISNVDGEPPPVILALVRIDRFDALHAALGMGGPEYLMGELANRIRAALGSCLIGHVREDMVGVLIPMSEGAEPGEILRRLVRCARDPFLLAEHSVPLRISVGASLFPRDASDAETLFKRARTALWSRSSVESGYQLYQRSYSHEATRRFRIESALKRGLERDEFSLVFQPKIDLASRHVVGAEALLRWSSETLGEVAPATFIPVAEASGLIDEVGSWVLRAACEQVERWEQSGRTFPEVAVNITSAQLRKTNFHKEVQRLIERHRLAPGQLNLELTEGSLVEDLESAVRIMRRLCELKVTLSIDDFGTGFSSLSYLSKMPVNVLKVDRSFVKGLPKSTDDRKLVRSIVSLGHDLGMKVVAEGVETERQLAFLSSVGCDQVQGFVLSPPLTVPELEHFLSQEDQLARSSGD